MIKVVARKDLSSFPDGKTYRRGLWEVSNDLLYTNAVHGSKEGELLIQHSHGGLVQVFLIQHFRRMLFDLMGIEDTGQNILITPCHSTQVVQKYQKELEAQNVFVMDEGSTTTHWTVAYFADLVFYSYYRSSSYSFGNREGYDSLVTKEVRALSDVKKVQTVYKIGKRK
jgi:hypothetical protein